MHVAKDMSWIMGHPVRCALSACCLISRRINESGAVNFDRDVCGGRGQKKLTAWRTEKHHIIIIIIIIMVLCLCGLKKRKPLKPDD